ncbi:hypothetical protein [Tateyamaria sp. ANG-S1]|uniref:hypothetical protein n=1 Tax=Tateyamaria sp. ANG-S1 TaxID=1577905 RepID=UPI00057DFF77|nr:hypothetical protein [Tateyamaria sp. ANG-S1]KIC52064.1 hypothetical protein RA29_01625 [Tateyamaria sp. ANG-S1]
MTVQLSDHAAPFIATSRKILLSQGITLTTGTDFEAYRDIVEEERLVQKLGAPFDPERYGLGKANAFWLIGRSEDGELIHTQAAKRVRLSARPLSGYLLRQFRAFPPPLKGVDLDRSRFRATPGTHKISGMAAYHGEFWVAPERGKYRGVGLAPVLGRTGMLEMMQRWDPDWIYGFILDVVAYKGFAARIGYLHLEPSVLKWVIEGRDAPIDTFLAYNSREDLEYLLNIPLSDVVPEAA